MSKTSLKTTGIFRALRSAAKGLLLLFTASVLITGCARYDIRLTNGTQFNNVRKPVLDEEKGTYTIKNASGKSFVVPKSRVLVIEPHESTKERMHDGSMFLN